MQTLVEHIHDRAYHNAELVNTRLDKLLCHRSYERQDGKDRRTSAHDVTQGDMEAVENASKTCMGTAQARDRQRLGQAHLVLWRPL